MKVNIKKLNDLAQVPHYAKEGDAGMDLVAISKDSRALEYVEYGTGLAIEIPEGYVGLIFPRSSISKYDLALANSVGVVDSGYRGEIRVRFKVTGNGSVRRPFMYEVSDRIAQLIILPIPRVVLEVVDTLEDSTRSDGGFGSTGK